MNDIESKVRDALRVHVDAKLGPRRTAPPFVPTPRPSRRVWVLPLLAAACVAAVVGATIGAIHLTASKRTAPATHGPSSVTTTPSPTPSRPTSSASSTHRSTSPITHSVTLGGATISLPAGWVARDYASYLTGGSEPLASPSWCLTPSTLPVSTKPGGCPVQFGDLDPSGNPVDGNTEGGFQSNPEYCGQVSPPYRSYQEQSEDRTFGGRAADWRRWEIDCTAGQQYLIEQYVVPTGPGFILWSERADATVHAALTEIATGSRLPAQTLPLRFYDEGYLRSITHTSSGVRITVDRIAYRDGKVINQNPQTYAYLVPTSVFDGTRAPVVGDLIYLATNGRQVTQLYRE